jgi:hypothetical protein
MAGAKVREACCETRNHQKWLIFVNSEAAGDGAALRKFTKG